MIISKAEELTKLEDNSFEGELPTILDSTIEFIGKGNVLYCDPGVTINKSRITFHGNNAIIYMSKNKNHYKLNISIHSNSTLYFGRDNYLDSNMTMVVSEEKNAFIGNECIFSTGITVRTSDAHMIFDCKTHDRVNYSKSIYIGDHVWVGQNAMILKGTQIDSGSIIGALSVVAGKKINHNTSNGGNPIRFIRNKLFWTRDCVHSWTSKETEANKSYSGKEYIYHYNDNQSIEFSEIEKNLTNKPPKTRIKYLQNLSENNDKNRFVHLIGHVKLKKMIIKLKKIFKKR